MKALSFDINGNIPNEDITAHAISSILFTAFKLQDMGYDNDDIYVMLEHLYGFTIPLTPSDSNPLIAKMDSVLSSLETMANSDPEAFIRLVYKLSDLAEKT